jgi:hypothetical protein
MLISDSVYCICTLTLRVGTKVSPSTIIPSMQILALQVCFEVRHEVMMVPSLLKCFPSVETLHIQVNLINLLSFISLFASVALLAYWP